MGKSEIQIQHEIQLAELEMKKAEEQLQQVKNQQTKLTVKSKHSGTVVSVSSIEDATDGGEPLVVIANMGNLKVEAKISELDVVEVKKAQHVTVQSDVFPGEEWIGKVTAIGFTPEKKVADTGDSQIEYPVEIKLEESIPAKLGSSLIVEIQTREAEVDSLPESAILDREGQFVVFVQEKKAVQKKVKTGLSHGGKVEIVSGLSVDDIVIEDPPEVLETGTEVTVP
ncbi:efflux RND transporter periplasmic adaptor subunit [Mechercharimyces sp. CAU 1602]|uniref:efflux RND transporter periplasmic adaptor subunit n=1 Tax=Mechercharimyces sp. CAU 1602 TaxID=2973933 RepID=UPI002162D0B5|nr:efflux RND transporter periplasmic adaptor subunit [Mechercharimyces sp. CAU 1602]MCS1350500.1 efflux RND transporter periplasmic adaptor subunit [Mechercharimyces sp. CAU 1602]